MNYHSTLKKNIVNLYSKTAIREFESKLDICTMLFVSKFSEIAKYDDKRVDMALWLHLYAFDSLAQINVSKNFGFIERGTDVNGMISATGRILHMTALVRLFRAETFPLLTHSEFQVRTSAFSSESTGIRKVCMER